MTLDRYILTHPKMTGEVELGYDAGGRLMLWHIRAELNTASYNKLLENIPTDTKYIDYYRNRGFDVKRLPPDLSFDAFYKAYGVNRNRIRAERYWSKMSDGQRLLAMQYIDKYRSECNRDGIRMTYPDTYLNNKRWMD